MSIFISAKPSVKLTKRKAQILNDIKSCRFMSKANKALYNTKADKHINPNEANQVFLP